MYMCHRCTMRAQHSTCIDEYDPKDYKHVTNTHGREPWLRKMRSRNRGKAVPEHSLHTVLKPHMLRDDCADDFLSLEIFDC